MKALRSHVLGLALVLVYVTGPGFDFSLRLYHLWLQPGLGSGRGITEKPLEKLILSLAPQFLLFLLLRSQFPLIEFMGGSYYI